MSENKVETSAAEGAEPVYSAPKYAVKAAGNGDTVKDSFMKSTFELRLGLLWLVTWLFGALFCEGALRGGSGFGSALVCAAFFACMLPFMKSIKPHGKSFLIPTIALAALELCFCLFASSYGRGWLVLATICIFIMSVASITGCSDKSQLCVGGALDGLFACVFYPVSNIGNTLSAYRNAPKKSEKAKNGTALKIIIGLVIALPVAAVLLLCFSCTDEVFASLTEEFIDNLTKRFAENALKELGGYALDLALGALLTLVFVPLVLTLRSGRIREGGELKPKRLLDGTICATVCFVAAAVYAIFIGVQYKYFFSVSLRYFFNPSYDVKLQLPNDMSWAEYARSGFFELSGIIAATFIAALLLTALAKRGENGRLPLALKIALTLTCACDLVLVLSAALRMRLYTIWCGLTGKRLAVLVIVAFFALCLLAEIARLWYEKLKLERFVIAFALLCIVSYAGMNADKLCASYNVERYLEQGTSIDVAYLGKLSCAAAPAVERLMNESGDELVSSAAKGILAKYEYYGDKPGELTPLAERRWGRQTADSLKAISIFEKYVLSAEDVDNYYRFARYQTAKTSYEMRNDDEFSGFEEFCESYEENHPYDDFTFHWYEEY